MLSITEKYPNGVLDQLQRVLAWFQTKRLARKLALLVTLAAIISGIATYFAITSSSNPLGPDPRTVLTLTLIDLALLLTLTAIVSRRLFKLWVQRRKGSVGSRLQTRIVVMFSLVSLLPTIIVAMFSMLFFNFGIQSWFDERISNALDESVAVAEAYLAEHKKVIHADVIAMAHDLNRSSHLLSKDPKLFNKVISGQAMIRSLTEALVFRGSDNKILAQSRLAFSVAFNPPPLEVINRARNGEAVILTNDSDDKVRALIKLDNFFDTFLLVGRFVDSKVLQHIESTRGSANEYKQLQASISDLQIEFYFVFVLVALLLLLAAIWFGIMFAVELVRPVSDMVDVTTKVKDGDLGVRVKEGPKHDELATLGRAFNSMTEQLERQRNELVNANRLIDERRRFSEAVLSSVSAGVIALDSSKRISMINRSALNLLCVSAEDLHGTLFEESIPGMASLLKQAEQRPDRPAQDEILHTCGEQKVTLLTRVAAENFESDIEGYVVTFDDITELLSAQRRAAWADVARRIAHEIKNPLTPIHLATERLKRKYPDQLSSSEKEMFLKYTDTIIRHVDNIGRIVEEFVNFARLPAPVFAEADISKLMKDAVFSQQCASAHITFEVDIPDAPMQLSCDEKQINQVMTNLLQNAVESVESKEGQTEGAVQVVVEQTEHSIHVRINDNGKGFPKDLLHRLTEPYVTTRAKGTGLGLAIVKKIMEDHEGSIELINTETGASVLLTFPITNDKTV